MKFDLIPAETDEIFKQFTQPPVTKPKCVVVTASTLINMSLYRITIFLLTLMLISLAATAQVSQNLPDPELEDVPYLLHGDSLVELEQLEATSEEIKNQLRYSIPGASSTARTPLASPEFLLKPSEINPTDLRLYGFDSDKGNRSLLYRNTKTVMAQPHLIQVSAASNGLALIRVKVSLPAGEYGLTPTGKDTVFAFTVF